MAYEKIEITKKKPLVKDFMEVKQLLLDDIYEEALLSGLNWDDELREPFIRGGLTPGGEPNLIITRFFRKEII